MTSSKQFTWRIQGLPLGVEPERVREELVEEEKEAGGDPEIFQKRGIDIDIVPSCTRPDTCVALVSIKGIPKFLQRVYNDEESKYQMVIDDNDVRIDCTFEGLTQLYENKAPKDVKAE